MPAPIVDRGAAPELRGRSAPHFELIVAGNPWLRALWVVGALAAVMGLSLISYAEYAFTREPLSGFYEPSAYVVPRLAAAIGQPFVTAGVVALVAATTLRIVAWRPRGTSAIVRD